MSEVAGQLAEIRNRIHTACIGVSRDPEEVRLIAVSKTFHAAAIQEAADAGQCLFGESRLQEAESKIAELSDQLEWHFIGGLQRNKVRKILPLFPYIHAIDSLKLAAYTDGVAKDLGLRPKIFLQVNLAGEASKGGFDRLGLLSSLPELCDLRHLDIVGLMSIPPPSEDSATLREGFRKVKLLRDEIESGSSLKLPFLSMGMSGDFEIAIEEGSTHIRVGSAIFGKRTYRVEGELGQTL